MGFLTEYCSRAFCPVSASVRRTTYSKSARDKCGHDIAVAGGKATKSEGQRWAHWLCIEVAARMTSLLRVP